MSALKNLEDAVAKCISEDGEVNSFNYHRNKIGEKIAKAYAEGWRQTDIEAIFEGVKASWNEE